jgi:cation transport regulator ChaB
MPYKSNSDLPPAVKKLPKHGQDIYRSAFNSAFKQYEGSESKSAATAWAAVKNKYKKSGGRWVAKGDSEMGKRKKIDQVSVVSNPLVPWPQDLESVDNAWAMAAPAGTYPIGAYPEGMECVLPGGELGKLVKVGQFLECHPCYADYDSEYEAEDSWLGDRTFTSQEREDLEKKGYAMKGGGFPIENKADLENARQALGRAKNRAATIAHIKKRAKALGVDLPSNWPNDSADRDPSGVQLMMHDSMTRSGDHWNVTETVILDRRGVHRRRDGYVAADARVARTGIQLYHGSELGDSRPVVKVYRPPSAVFNRDSMATFSSRPITNDHPPEMVTADNWRSYAVGYTGEDIARDGEFIRVPMTLCDAQTIQEFNAGRRELSVGYSCDLDWSGGVTDSGEKYDAAQKDIMVNHVAFVARARGGSKLKFGDSTTNNGDGEMQMKTISVDGLDLQLPEPTATAILRAFAARDTLIAQIKDQGKKKDDDEDDMEDSIKELKKRCDASDAVIATLTKQLEDTKADAAKQLSPAAMDARVHEFADTMAKAKAVLGDQVDLRGKQVMDIKRLVVVSQMGDAAAKWSDEGIEASFHTITAAPKVGAGYKDTANWISGALQSPGYPDSRSQMSPSDKAYYEMVDSMQNAWRGDSWGKDQHQR